MPLFTDTTAEFHFEWIALLSHPLCEAQRRFESLLTVQFITVQRYSLLKRQPHERPSARQSIRTVSSSLCTCKRTFELFHFHLSAINKGEPIIPRKSMIASLPNRVIVRRIYFQKLLDYIGHSPWGMTTAKWMSSFRISKCR